MKKISVTIFICMFYTCLVFAQTAADSLSIVSIQWNIEKVRKGVVWKNAQTTVFGSPQSIHILEIKPTKRNRLAIGFCVDTLITTSSLCNQANAIAGVNASFFDMKNGGSVDYMRVDGKMIHEGSIAARANAALVFQKKNVSIVKQPQGNDSLWAHKLVGDNIMVTGPFLVDRGIMENLQNSSDAPRHPRTCIATRFNETILLVTVDGRHDGKAAGMSLYELAFFLKILGAKQAANLDGGGSTTMFIKNKGRNGVVNYPSDNQKFDHEGERKVANIVYIK